MPPSSMSDSGSVSLKKNDFVEHRARPVESTSELASRSRVTSRHAGSFAHTKYHCEILLQPMAAKQNQRPGLQDFSKELPTTQQSKF